MSHPAAPPAPRDRGPDVRFPPPLPFAAGFALAELLSRWLPLTAPWAGALWALLLGALVIVGGLAVGVAGVRELRRARVALYPNRAARSLVEGGVYAYTRNPIYLAFTMVYVGAALIAHMMWPFLLLPFVLTVIMVAVIRREERHLRERFPAEFAEYCRRVRRWL